MIIFIKCIYTRLTFNDTDNGWISFIKGGNIYTVLPLISLDKWKPNKAGVPSGKMGYKLHFIVFTNNSITELRRYLDNTENCVYLTHLV